MKNMLALLAIVIAAATISGCYYDPGYSYVRQSAYQGDAYYGEAAPAYNSGYYGGSSGYYGGGYGGYGYPSGVSVGISSGWYAPAYYRRGNGYYNGYYRQGYRGRHHDDHRRDHRGSRDHRDHYDRRDHRTDRHHASRDHAGSSGSRGRVHPRAPVRSAPARVAAPSRDPVRKTSAPSHRSGTRVRHQRGDDHGDRYQRRKH